MPQFVDHQKLNKRVQSVHDFEMLGLIGDCRQLVHLHCRHHQSKDQVPNLATERMPGWTKPNQETRRVPTSVAHQLDKCLGGLTKYCDNRKVCKTTDPMT
jgi:hypothetical protein